MHITPVFWLLVSRYPFAIFGAIVSVVIDAIDAHEMAHIILEHGNNEPNPMEEMAADYFAILILNALNNKESAEILIDNFKERHGILYEEAEEKIDEVVKEAGSIEFVTDLNEDGRPYWLYYLALAACLVGIVGIS